MNRQTPIRPSIPRVAMSLALLLTTHETVSADDKPTPITGAAAAVEANMKTPEGKKYDDQIGTELGNRYSPVMKACKEKAEGDFRSFDVLVSVNSGGTVKEVLLYPPTKISQCLREAVLKDKFPPPPKPSHWVNIHMDIRR
jgi:hypothetical protein